jgi:protein XRP2
MPPKVFTYKTPDGKVFTSKAEYRDYMMANFFSFKEKKNEPNPLLKVPGDIDGQVFDIADCENSTLVVMDKTEQVQIDNCKNCRIFIGACSSSIFARNCENCVFYTVCRQLRLREVTQSTFNS